MIAPAPADDLALQWVYRNQTFVMLRNEDDFLDPDNYKQYISAGLAVNQRHQIAKRIASVNTVLGGENGYTPGSPEWGIAMFSISGTNMKAFRSDLVTAKFTATDSALTSGKMGKGGEDAYLPVNNWGESIVLSPQSPTPRPWEFFEVPVVERVDLLANGEEYRYFCADLPPADTPTYSAVIKTGKDGKPVDYRAIVRLFDNSPAKVLTDCKTALMAKVGVVRLDADTAIEEAMTLDDLLTPADFEDKSASEMKGWTP